jgi:[ribosomal protein S18]-alanine N-acetyltransferase
VVNAQAFTVRPFQADAFDRMLEIEHEVHPNPWSGEFFHKQLAASAQGLLSYLGELPVGYLVYQQLIDEVEVLNMATAKNQQNQGYASALLEHFMLEASARDVQQVYLEVAKDNDAAISLYRKFLFQQTGLRAHYYQRDNGRCDALLMARKLP